MAKNWMGMETHESDQLFSWRHFKNVRDGNKIIATVTEVRNAWDLITQLGPEYEKALKVLLEKQSEVSEYNAIDNQYP